MTRPLPVLVPFAASGDRNASRGAEAFARFIARNGAACRLPDHPFFRTPRRIDLDALPPHRHAAAFADVFAEAEAEGTGPAFLGGDHGLTFHAAGAALARHGRLALIVLDAHTDLQGDERELRNWNVLRRLAETAGPALRILHIGCRDLDAPALRRHGIESLDAADLIRGGMAAAADRMRAAAEAMPAYLSIDLDVLDPLAFRAVRAPISGGLAPAELLFLVRSLAGTGLAGADIVEYSPTRPLAAEMLLMADIFFHLGAALDRRSLPR